MDEKTSETVNSSKESTGEPSKCDEKSSGIEKSQSEIEKMDTDEPLSKSDDKKDDTPSSSLVDKAYLDDKSRSQSKSPSPNEEKDKTTQNSDQNPAEPAQSNEEPGKCFLQLNFLLKCFEYNSRVRVFIK